MGPGGREVAEAIILVAELKAQLEVAREAYKQLIAQLERLNETTEQGVNVDDLEGARP